MSDKSVLENFGGAVEQRLSELNDSKEESSGKDEQKASGGKESWASVGGERYIATGTTREKLKRGMYSFYNTDKGLVFDKQNALTDELISSKNSEMDKVLNEVNQFWGLGEVFSEHGFLQRRGILLWGKQGCGKSAIVQLVAQSVIRNDGIVLLCNEHPDLTEQALQNFREVEPKRNLVCIYEDIEAIIETKARENKLLSILDGEIQIDKVLNLATTNYPQYLDPRIVGRPRRFDRLINIQPPDSEMRKQYFQKKLNIDGNEVDEWVEKTEGMSFASLAEAVISVKCFGHGFDETVERLSELEKKFEDGKMGFGK